MTRQAGVQAEALPDHGRPPGGIRHFGSWLALVCAVAVILRFAYLMAQPRFDPAFARPMLDGAYYWEWARAWAAGRPGPPGAFYLAPAYPFALSLLFRLVGDQAFGLVYLLQHGLIVAGAALLAWGTRHRVGDPAALSAAILFLAYHPTLFFASQPIGEALAVFLLIAALAVAGRKGSPAAGLAGGVLGGLAALARPNLLLAAALWTLEQLGARRVRQGLMLAAGCGLVLLPVLVRNLVVSGHPVPISSNAGLTLYHGNGPGADGVGLLPPEFSGKVATQQEEATRIASVRSGLGLDPVAADRWWGAEALRVRLADPAGTLRLLLRRGMLTLAATELTLDYAPSLDLNPLRFAAPLPFALLVGLAAAGLLAVGFVRCGGPPLWLGIVATAATPLLFFVSSRYRFPMAALLCVPAGAGVAALCGFLEPTSGRRRVGAALLAAAVGAGSWAVPTAAPMVRGESTALANRAVSWTQVGNPDAAERDLRRALERDGSSTMAWFGLGHLQQSRGQTVEAEASYRRALELSPSSAEAAGNLAQLLIGSGRAAEAVVLLSDVLVRRPHHEVSWTNLVVAYVTLGRVTEAEQALEQAARYDVGFDPELVRWVRQAAAADRAVEALPER